MTQLSDQITFSVVSHGQAELIYPLLNDLAKLPHQNFEVLVTINLPEDESAYHGHPFPLRIIRNTKVKGFGCNHNFAFTQSRNKWFVVINPDIRIESLNIEQLLSPFENKYVGAVAPIILSGEGEIEDSARYFPTLWRLANRVLFGQRGPDYKVEEGPYFVDWVAGMFVVFRRDAFADIGGFDDRRFFMYLEDADICRRLLGSGWKTLVNPRVRVIHLAQRASRRNIKHMRWHLLSALRYLTGV